MRQRVRSRHEGSPRQRQSDGFSDCLEWVTESPACATPPYNPCSAPPPPVSTASENSATPPQMHSRGLGWLASLALGVSEVFNQQQQQQQQFDGTAPAAQNGQTQDFDAFSDWCELEHEDAPERNGLPASAALHNPTEGSLYFPNSRSRILGSTKVSTTTKTSSSLRRRVRTVDERPSRSYANMLKAGVARSAVRYRMRGDGCSASTVQCILGNEVPLSCLKCNERRQTSSVNNSSTLVLRASKSCTCLLKNGDGALLSSAQDTFEVHSDDNFAGRLKPRSTTPKISDSDLIEADEKAIRSFRGMMSAGMPTSIIKEKMISDGLSPSVIAEVTREPLSEVEAQNAISNGKALSSSKDNDVKKALLALFNSDPLPGEQRIEKTSSNHTLMVKEKTRDNSNTESSACATYAEKATSVPVEQSCPAGLDKDKSLPQKYQKMMQAGVPLMAVRHKMVADGVPEKEIDSLLELKRDADIAVAAPASSAQSPIDAPESDGMPLKYKKMVQAGVPLMAVRHKMVADGVPEKEIDLVLETKNNDTDEAVAAPASSAHSPTDTPKSDGMPLKYKKMVQAGVPPMAVRHKMLADGIPETEIEFFLRPESDQSGEYDVYVVEKSSSGASDAGNARSQKYKKMLQAGVPLMAVRHKMVADGIPDTEIDRVLHSDKTPSEGVPGFADSADHEQDLRKYRAMLKAGVPPQAVEQKMTKDGIERQLIRNVVGGDSPSCLVRSPAVAASTLITVHWTPLGLSKEDFTNSVWGSGSSSMVPSKEMVRLEELFTKKPAVKSGKFAKSKSEGSLSQSAQVKKKECVLDNARMQNLAIGLRSFRSVDPVSIGQSLNTFNSNEFSLEQLPRLSEMIPTEAEISAVQSHVQRLESVTHKRDDGVRSDEEASVRGTHGLESPEAFCLGFLGVQRPRKKLNVLTFMKTFSTVAFELLGKLNLLSRSIDQIEKSTRLAKLLAKILTVGNVMNKGTSKGGARGITVDSLLKLTQTKSTCKTMSFLDFVVDSLLNAGDDTSPSILTFFDDLPDLVAASKIPLSELSAQVAQLQADLREAESELKLLRKDDAERATMHLGHRGPGSDAVEAGVLRASGQPAEESDPPARSNPQADLLSAIKAKSSQKVEARIEPDKPISSYVNSTSSNPQANLLDAIKKKASKSRICSGDDPTGTNMVDINSSNPVAELHAAIRRKVSDGNNRVGEFSSSTVRKSKPRTNLLAAIEARGAEASSDDGAIPLEVKPLESKADVSSQTRANDSAAAEVNTPNKEAAANGCRVSPLEASVSPPMDVRTSLLAAIKSKKPKIGGCLNDGNVSASAVSSQCPPPVLGKSADALERCVKVASARVDEVKVAEAELRARSKDLAAFFGEREQDATHIITCLATFAGMVKESKMKLNKGSLK